MQTNDREYWLGRALDVIEMIYEHDYFVSGWERVKHTSDIADLEKRDILKPFQDFWNLLPDSPTVRRYPFSSICDLAEEYMFGDEPFVDGDFENANPIH